MEREIPLLCIGTKGSKERVRAIKFGEGLYVFPSYSSDIKWYEDSDSGDIIVYNAKNETQKVAIDKTRTIDTNGQCWGIHPFSIHISSDEDFFYNIARLFGGNDFFINKEIDEIKDSQEKGKIFDMILIVFILVIVLLLVYYAFIK